MKRLDTKKKVRIISFIFIAAVFAVWGLFYYFISDYIADRTNRQMEQAADQIIERFGGEFSQIERLTHNLKENTDVNALMWEPNPYDFFALAGKIEVSLDAKAINPDFIDSIVLIGADHNYYRLAGRLGNKSCQRLANMIYTLDMPSHLSIELENRRYIGYADAVALDETEQPGAVVILIEEERILELLSAYDQFGQLLVAISANNEVIAANTDMIDLFAPGSLHQPVIHSRLGITPYRISVAADAEYMNASLKYVNVVALITAAIIGVMLFVYNSILNKSFFMPVLLQAKNAEIEKQKALVFSLKKQINAHFTINTLNTVRLLVERGELEKAETVAMGLTSLVRYAYDREELINIWDELGVLEDYIFIMNSRYNNKLEVDFDFDDLLMDYHMPRMLLQPVIENSIVHGFKEMEKECFISVTAKLYNGSACFTVRDNGRGMSEKELSALSDILNGSSEAAWGYENIALSNIKNRLRYYFGDAGCLNIDQSVTGVEVSITIPLITETGGPV